MSGEIVVSETPNWLQELEAKRERRLKVKLGHEAGAGAPCLKCGDNCPGLDLHFWRKCCKICKCPKEEHEVQDDDIYGWAQFQLLGSKPNKIKTKILLPGKKDEIDLDWVPKGHNDTVEKYLKTLPPEQLPVKGSQAAQDRKQLLQKQIPIHDIDPALCHDLTEDELKQMNEYIAYVKQSSAGVGQIVSLSSIIKGKLHMLNSAEAAVLANRYGKGVPMSEIVKLQSQNRTGSLSQNLEKLSLKNKNLPQFNPNAINQTEDISNPVSSTKIHDKDYPLYSNEVNIPVPNAQFSAGLASRQLPKTNPPNIPNASGIDTSIDPKYLQNPNFDPANRPSNFAPPNPQYNPAIPRDKVPFGKTPLLEYNSENSAFVPYQKISSVPKPAGASYWEDNALNNPNYAKNISGQTRNQGNDKPSLPINNPNYQNVEDDEQIYENLKELKKPSGNLPNYLPGKYNTYADTQSPTRIPKNVKDLAFSTYEANQMNPKEIQDQDNGFRFGKYRQPGSYSDELPKNSGGFRPIEAGNYGNTPQQYAQDSQQFKPVNPLYPGAQPGEMDSDNGSFNPNSHPGNYGDAYSAQYNALNPHSYLANSTGIKSGNLGGYGSPIGSNAPSKPYSGLKAEDVAAHNAQYDITNSNLYGVGDSIGQNTYSGSPFGSGDLSSATTEFDPSVIKSYPNNLNLQSDDVRNRNRNVRPEDVGYNNAAIADLAANYQQSSDTLGRSSDGDGSLKIGKKLSELYPSDIRVSEDFVNPNQVNIGLIQDINYPDIKTATHEIGDFYEEYSPDSIKEILNNVILPDCHYCGKPFEENEFAVTIDRANALFHAGCFKCAGCNQILADNVYFYNKETDNVYCLRDYAKIRGFPRCKACDELIFTKEYCLAENCTFHLKHFCCTECDMPLAGQDYLLEDEMPYCLPCFEQNKASKCNTCLKIIKPDEVGCTLKGIHFHVVDACFACKICKTPLMEKKLLLRNDKLYCSHNCYGADQ